MSLLSRIIGEEEPKINNHQLWASMRELAAGQITKADLMTAHNLVAATSDETELDFLIAQYQSAIDQPAFLEGVHYLSMLAEAKLHGYDVKATLNSRLQTLSDTGV